MKKRISITINEQVHDDIKKQAENEYRSVSGMIEVAAKRYLKGIQEKDQTIRD